MLSEVAIPPSFVRVKGAELAHIARHKACRAAEQRNLQALEALRGCQPRASILHMRAELRVSHGLTGGHMHALPAHAHRRQGPLLTAVEACFQDMSCCTLQAAAAPSAACHAWCLLSWGCSRWLLTGLVLGELGLLGLFGSLLLLSPLPLGLSPVL